MDMQLQDKLLEYKRDMGLLSTGTAQPSALPAQGETGTGINNDALLKEGAGSKE
jgi:hypothetical protein